MKRIIAILAVLALGTGCASTGSAPNYSFQTSPNQVVKKVDGNKSVYSMGDSSFVTLSPRFEKLSQHHGPMFVVAAFNQSGKLTPFGPAQIRVTDEFGRPMRLLDGKRVQEIERKRQRGKKFLSGFIAAATTIAVTYAAGDYIADQQMAGFDTRQLTNSLSYIVAGIGQSAFSAASLYNKNLDKAVKAQTKHFEKKALRPQRLAKNESGGGFFIVEGKSRAMIVTVTSGTDRHTFRLTRQ